MALRSCEEFEEVTRRLVGSFLGQEMPGPDRAAANLLAPGAPDLQRLVPVGEGAAVTPQGQDRTGDLPSATVGLVVLVIERGGGAVLLADGVDGVGSAELGDVGGADLRRESGGYLGQGVEHVVDDDGWSLGDQPP